MQTETTYAEASRTKYPEQVAVAIAKDPQGKYNPIALGWAMPASGSPPMWAISVGKTRYSLEAIRGAKAFVLAFPSEHQERETLLFGTRSGRDTDKLAEAGVATRPAAEIDSVLLDEAVANLECRLVGEIESGDHVIFVGRVVCAHVNTEPLNRLYTVGPGYQMGGLARKAAR